MPAKVKDKGYLIDQKKLNRAKKILGRKTETQTVDRALDLVLAEERIDHVPGRAGGRGGIDKAC